MTRGYASNNRQSLMPTDLVWQRALLAACIILAPLSITLYLVAWTGSGRQPIDSAAMVGATGNTLRLIGAVAPPSSCHWATWQCRCSACGAHLDWPSSGPH